MADVSDALRVVVGKVSTVTDGDFLARLASGQQIACDCADFIREHGAALAQALEDSARLDFLEATGWPGQFHADPAAPAATRWFDCETTGSDYSPTLRAAISSAIAAQQKEAANGD